MFQHKKHIILLFVLIFSFVFSGCFIFKPKKKCDCPTFNKANSVKVYHTNRNGYKELSNFDSDRPGVYIEDLPDGMVFHTADDQLYRKEKKIRKRILCTRLKNNAEGIPMDKKYLFSPIYRVFPLKNKQYVMVFPFVFIFLPQSYKPQVPNFKFKEKKIMGLELEI